MELIPFPAVLVRELLRAAGVRAHGHVPLVLHRGPALAQRAHHQRLSAARQPRVSLPFYGRTLYGGNSADIR